MFEMKITINGRPVTPANIKDAFEHAIYEGIREHITEKLRDIGTSSDGRCLEVELVGPSIDELSVSLSGPEELIEKARAALGDS